MRRTLEILNKADKHDNLVDLYRLKELKLEALRTAIAKVGGAGYPVPTPVTVARRAFYDADLAFERAMKEAAGVV